MPFIKNVAIFASKLPPEVKYPIVEAAKWASLSNSYSLGTKSTGRLFGWGDNTFAKMPMFTNPAKTPTSILGPTRTFCKISVATNSGVGIDNYGKGWGWGYNEFFVIAGANQYTQYYSPISLYGSKTFCKISAGQYDTVHAIDKNGKVWGWGRNIYGELGINNTTIQSTPVALYGTKTFCEIASGQGSSSGIDKNGKAWSWGANFYGQLGDASYISKITPVSVYGSKTFCKISSGGGFVVAIDKNGKGWGWGLGNVGQLGNNSSLNPATPVAICGTRTFCKISAGLQFSVAIDKNGKAWSWGFNDKGQLGDNSLTQRPTPVSVYGSKTFCDISAGNYHTLAVDKSGKLWSWGYDDIYQLGANKVYDKCTPISLVATNKTFCSVVPSNFLVIGANRSLWGWGLGAHVGDQSDYRRKSPISMYNPSNLTVCQAAAGGYHTIIIDSTGKAWGWGYNYYGEAGNQSFQYYPQCSVIGTTTFCKVGAGGFHSAGIDKNGIVWTWGANFYGQLGRNTTDYNVNRTPKTICGTTKTFCQICGGEQHFTAIDKNGKLWGWGNNNGYQIGDGTATARCTPVSVLATNKTFCKIAAATNHCLAIDKNGKIWGWGLGYGGQIGTGAATAYPSPVQIYGSKTFCHIAVAQVHSAAIDKNGKAWTWGDNSKGQLGNGTTTAEYTPISVYGTKTFCGIGAYSTNTFAIDKNGKIWAWGNWSNIGIDAFSTTPIAVCGY